MAEIKRCFILDRSGSMATILHDTIGGYNSFINTQKEIGGTISLYLFDHEIQTVYENKNIKEVEQLDQNTYVPRGSTALLDTIGKTITKINNETPNEKYTVIILTDGQENASSSYNLTEIKLLIQQYTEEKGWDFMYLGANQDAIQEAQNIGINGKNALNYDNAHVENAFNSASTTISQKYNSPRPDEITLSQFQADTINE